MKKSDLIKLLEPYPDDIEIWQDDGALILPIQPVVEEVVLYRIEYYHGTFWELKRTKKDKILKKKKVLLIGL